MKVFPRLTEKNNKPFEIETRIDLDDVPDFDIHIPGHHRWKFFFPALIVVCLGLIIFVLAVSLK